MRAIIPCAGFGTRMGMAADESKEMMWLDGKFRLIDQALNLCRAYSIEPYVILREEKKDLKRHLVTCGVDFMVIKPSAEWHATVLQSAIGWHDDNVLLLPDTYFWPHDKTFSEIKTGLALGNKAVFALHGTNAPEKWGVVHNYTLYDKPQHLEGTQWAWGLIGFKKEYGEQLFSAENLKNGLPLQNAGFTYLISFEDVTREHSSRVTKF